MAKKILLSLVAVCLGLALGYLLVFALPFPSSLKQQATNYENLILKRPTVIGFLPYWLLANAKSDYSSYLTNITYFDLTIADDGTIQKLNNPQEQEPGWNNLNAGTPTASSCSLMINTGKSPPATPCSNNFFAVS